MSHDTHINYKALTSKMKELKDSLQPLDRILGHGIFWAAELHEKDLIPAVGTVQVKI